VPPAALADGPAPIGIEASEQHMRVVIVPIAYTSATCTATPPVDEAALQPYEDALFQQNPLESLELEIHAPLVVDDVGLGVVDGLHVLVDRLVALRVDDDPDPNVYYYGLLDNCGACMQLPGGGCVTGLAAGIPGAAESDASLRVAAGVRTLYAEEVGPIAFVHEIGHSQGRRHVACPNTEPADVDPDFPHPDGDIGTWGFGIRDFMVYRGDLYGDYMSYCYPQWVSDYQWSATFERIRAMTELGDGAVVPPTDEMLIGTVDTDSGASRWWIEHGDVESADATADLVLLGDGIEVHATTAFVSPWSGGPWRTVRANLPDRAVIAQADAFALDLPELDLVIPLADVRPARIR
jgi:hypothetical protein